ncbi:hypothetical protein C6570_07905 [Ottowia oryzae]|uniref:DUF2059 domain-containing protein n=2 Tax=Ottowia oryzae TaxID=2109914 RepID=A0A2S0MEM5_9BURK|nr:hypothetical protein C6570_07905 [Ottowia oryzae]
MELALNATLSKFPIAILFAAACAASTGAMAQNDSKRALAVKLAQMQQKADGSAMAEQLTASAVQPLLAGWSQRLDETVPPARQKDVRDKLDVELKKYADSTQKVVEAQTAKAAEAALVPIFMEKLSEEELKQIVAYMESPASAKFQALGPDATNAWAKRIVDATKPQVENGAKNFEAAANRIVTSNGGSSPAKK